MSYELRDKVYSLLNLVKRECYGTGKEDLRRRELRVQYEDDISQVYLEAAWYILLSGDDLRYLAQAGCWDQNPGLKKTEATDLPPWAPALDIVPSVIGLQEVAVGPKASWRAAGEHTWKAPEASKLYQRVLAVQATKINYICEVASGPDSIVSALNAIRTLPPVYNWIQERVLGALWLSKCVTISISMNPRLLGSGIYLHHSFSG
jgi:hypothetical protein